MSDPKWAVRLSADAEVDFANILRETLAKFGLRQAQKYRDIVLNAITALADGPEVIGSKSRSDIRPGLRTLPVAGRGRRARHVLLYQGRDGRIEILRILHDAMDLRRHAPPDEG